ncbi:glycosyltransferase family 4 protein [Collinsella ihumii]|uniref:Glycosyltransferase family 4 protein n=1 Tax=Collinsella ihumii TaxID=1720204 RepID=A0AAW7JSS8_9ACTN|nr:glycosyltransferase family 4 protein [Collinsella ihumii]MDN0069452.1 glycosyltransferase family 4 protein [Collinsella ihumii]
MVCQRYWPEHFQITEICEELVRRKHEVTALVGIPNYPMGVIPEEYLYGRNREQSRNGVRIVRVEEVPRKPSVIGLARNYWSYMSKASSKIVKIKESYDVIFTYQLSPVLMSAPAMRAKKLLGTPVLLYCADIWPDAVRAMLPDSLRFLMPVIRRVSTRIYQDSDMIATNSRAYIDCFEQIHGIERSRCRYVPQYADDAYLDMDLSAEPSDKTKFMVMGNIGKLQYLQVLMEAVDLLKDRGDFELHVVGTGSAIGYCEDFVTSHGLEGCVVFHGRHPVKEMPRFYRMADACVLTLHVPGAPWISSTLPSRLQGYMAAGKPVLAAIDGSAAEVIAESGCGASVSGTDSAGLAALMEDFMDNREKYAGCGKSGRAYFRENFMRDRYMDDIESLLIETAKGR